PGILADKHPDGFEVGGKSFWYPDNQGVQIESRIAAILDFGASRWEMVFVLADGRIHLGDLAMAAFSGKVPDLQHLEGLWPGGSARGARPGRSSAAPGGRPGPRSGCRIRS